MSVSNGGDGGSEKSQSENEASEDVTKEILCLFGNGFDFLDSTKSWLSSEVKCIEDDNLDRQWLDEPFQKDGYVAIRERLTRDLRALKYSPNNRSYDTRTYTKNKKLTSIKKHPSNGLSKFTDEDIIEECVNRSLNETFSVSSSSVRGPEQQRLYKDCDESSDSSGRAFNQTFTPPRKNSTFCKSESLSKTCTAYMDVHEIARMQEETLCSLEPVEERCSPAPSTQTNGYSREEQLDDRRDSLNSEHNFDTILHQEYEETPLMSTPLHAEKLVNPHIRYVETANYGGPSNSPPKIMPNVTNLRLSDRNGPASVGRSLPNLSRRMAGAANSQADCGSNPYLSKQNGDNLNSVGPARTSAAAAVVPDSRSAFRAPQGRPQFPARFQNPSLASKQNQAINNIKRTATFKVRPLQACSSDENIRLSNQNNNGVEECSLGKSGPLKSVTNIRAVNGSGSSEAIQANVERLTAVPKPSSKIPGPKTARSGIPIPGARTLQVPATVTKVPSFAAKQACSHRDLSNGQEDDKSWRNGCY